MFLDKQQILETLDTLLEEALTGYRLEVIDEVAMKRVVRAGKIIKKVKVKKKGFKVVRQGNNIRFVRMTMQEKRARRKAARKAWRTGKAARKTKAARTIRKSKVKIKMLHGRK